MRQIFNIRTLLLSSLLTFAIASATAGSGHDLKSKFGGVVVETKAGDVEIVAKPDSIQIYVTDHGKVVKLDAQKPRSPCSMAQKKARLS